MPSEFWNRAEICHFDLFSKMNRTKDLLRHRSSFCWIMELVPSTLAADGYFVLSEKSKLVLRKWNLQDGTFQLGTGRINDVDGAQIFIYPKDKAEYSKVTNFKLISCNESSVKFRLHEPNNSLSENKSPSQGATYQITFIDYVGEYVDPQVASRLQIDIHKMLDPARSNDEQFDNIFDTDITFSFTRAFSIVDHHLQLQMQDQRQVFPTDLVKLLLEYAK